jgi:glycosyltransferase involved in cell wall biosynthesis
VRILVAHNVSIARTGGMSRIMGFIHDELARDGHEIEYLTAEDLPAAVRGRPARLAFPALVLGRAVNRWHERRPFDIINVHEPSSAAITTLKRLAGNPQVVVTSHGVERRAWKFALEEIRLGRGWLPLRTRIVYPPTQLWQSDLGLHCADHVFCLNYEDRDYLRDRMGVASERITRIYPAAAEAFHLAGEGRIAEGGDQLLFAGTWRKNKGIDDLVAAFTLLANRHADLRLTILGAGVPDLEVLNAFPETVRGRIRCAHGRFDAELAQVYASSHIFIQPSLFEGTPLTLLEAMACGLPLVTTATCGMLDVIEDGRNGLLIPIREPDALVGAVERLRADPDLRIRLGHNARRDARERYVWRVVADPVRSAYEALSLKSKQARVGS